MQRKGEMHLNRTHLVDAAHSTQLLEKSGIYEAELTLDAKVQVCMPRRLGGQLGVLALASVREWHK